MTLHRANRKLILLLLLLGVLLIQTPAQAAGTVGTGTPASCTEAGFNTAKAGGGNVDFNCGGLPHTIVFTVQSNISANTTVDGGNVITLSGGGTTRILSITAGFSLTLENITLADGNSVGTGAAVNANANTVLTVTNSSFINNVSTAPGGAILVGPAGVVTVTDSTFSGNSANQGGAINVNGAGALVTINTSTFNNNTATGSVGAGGAIINFATLVINNSTFTANTATNVGAGGAIQNIGTLTINNSTLAGNTSPGSTGGGIHDDFGSGTSTTLSNTLVTNNTGGNCFNAVINGGNNLQFGGSEPDSCGASIPTADPLLEPLASNGGPTQTMALGAGSPAIDAGNNATCTATDQRGNARTDGDGNGSVICDIGAFEAAAFLAPGPIGPIPTLNQWGLLLLSLLLAGFGIKTLGSKRTIGLN